MSNRPRLRPHEQAKMDQRRAEARERARAGQVVVVADYATGQQCSWCECPIVDTGGRPLPPHTDCGGCPEPAEYVMTLGYGTPAAGRYPVCEYHHSRFAEDVVLLLKPGVVELAPPWEDSPTGGTA